MKEQAAPQPQWSPLWRPTAPPSGSFGTSRSARTVNNNKWPGSGEKHAIGPPETIRVWTSKRSPSCHPCSPRQGSNPARAPFRALSCSGSQGNKAVDRGRGVRLGRREKSRPSLHGRPHSPSLCPDRLRNREPPERPARLPGAGARLLGPRPRLAAPGPHHGVMTASSPSPPRS